MKSVARALLGHPGTFDIVVSDFGRVAAIRLIALIEKSERRLIHSILRGMDMPFYDEYRRISFSLIGDVRFLKSEMIEQLISKRDRLTDEILVGVNGAPVPLSLIGEIVDLCAAEIEGAYLRGHREFRVCLPCNTLSRAVNEVVASLHSHRKLETMFSKSSSDGALRIRAVTVVNSNATNLLEDNSRKKNNVIVLGTRLTNETYAEALEGSGISVLPLNDDHYAIIDECVVASISGRSDLLEITRNKLCNDVVENVLDGQGDAIVIEACTDFDYGLGESSLENMANWLVRDAYRDFKDQVQFYANQKQKF